jgi:DNA repair protein RadA/Sms
MPEGMIAIGEVGLSGEVRGVSYLEARVAEVGKMGFTKCIVPKTSLKQLIKKSDIELVGITRLVEVMENLF